MITATLFFCIFSILSCCGGRKEKSRGGPTAFFFHTGTAAGGCAPCQKAAPFHRRGPRPSAHRILHPSHLRMPHMVLAFILPIFPHKFNRNFWFFLLFCLMCQFPYNFHPKSHYFVGFGGAFPGSRAKRPALGQDPAPTAGGWRPAAFPVPPPLQANFPAASCISLLLSPGLPQPTLPSNSATPPAPQLLPAAKAESIPCPSAARCTPGTGVRRLW